MTAFSRMIHALFLVFAVVFAGIFSDAAYALETLNVRNSSGNVVFQFLLYGPGDGNNGSGSSSTRAFTANDKAAILSGASYWVERLCPAGTVVQPIVIKTGTNRVVNASCGPTLFYDAVRNIAVGGMELVLINKTRIPQGNVHAEIMLGNLPWGYQPSSQLPESSWISPYSAATSMESVIIHEMGHGLGIMGDNFGSGITDRWYKLCDQNNPLRPVFKGAAAKSVYGDVDWGKTPRAVPLNYENGAPDLGHFNLKKGLMTHLDYRNYPGFMEVELASLQDFGYAIDRRNFFGRSVYVDGQTLINNYGYSARNAAGTQYVAGQYNMSTYGLGLHVYADNIDITQNAHLLSGGVGGGGIRTDGFGNTIRIAPNVKVHAVGTRGIGLLVAYGTNSTVIHRGDLQATGSGGIAARFDFGNNALGDIDRYVGYPPASSTTQNHRSYMPGNALLQAPLVKRFDVTGSLGGGAAAIYMSNNAHVAEINIMRGASVKGAVISDFRGEGAYSTAGTRLTFGKNHVNGVAANTADAAFNFVVGSGILGYGAPAGQAGRGFIDMQLIGGKTTIASTASVRVRNLTMNTGTTLVLGSTVQAAGTFAMNNATLGYNATSKSTLQVAQTASITGTNTLDFSAFANGTYTIISAGAFSGKKVFDTITVAGAAISSGMRHSITWITTSPNAIVAKLAASNTTLTWSAGSGIWNASQGNWGDYFIGGDEVVFNAGTGNVHVGYVEPVAMMVSGAGTAYTFTAGHVNVTRGKSSFSDPSGLLSVTDGALAHFKGTVAARHLAVDNATLALANDMSIRGNASFVNATLEFEADRRGHVPGLGDFKTTAINVLGTATVDGGGVNFTSGAFRRGMKYDFLTAQSLLVHNPFALGALPAGTVHEAEGLGYNSTSYWLRMSGALANYRGVAVSGNHVRFADYLASISPYTTLYSDMNAVLAELDDLVDFNPGAARSAYDQLSGASYGSVGTAAVQNVLSMNNTLSGTLRNGLFVSPHEQPDPIRGEAALAALPVEKMRPCGQGVNAWALGYTLTGRTDRDANAAGYRQYGDGAIVGLGWQGYGRQEIGVFGSYVDSELRVREQKDRTKGKEWMAGVYGKLNSERFYALATAGLGTNRYRTTRNVDFGTVSRTMRSKYSIHTWSAYGEGGYKYTVGRSSYAPFVGMQYVGIRRGGIAENGGDSLNLIAPPQSTDVFRSTAGVRYEWSHPRVGEGRLSLNGSAAWMHEYGNGSTVPFTGRLEGGQPLGVYTVKGNSPGRDWAVIGAGVSYSLRKARLFVGYDGLINNRQRIHSGNAGLSVSF